MFCEIKSSDKTTTFEEIPEFHFFLKDGILHQKINLDYDTYGCKYIHNAIAYLYKYWDKMDKAFINSDDTCTPIIKITMET